MSNEVVAFEGPSNGEELVLLPAYCNFSTLNHHTHNEAAVSAVWWCNVVFVPLIAVCGLAANLLNIAILTGNRTARRIPSWQLLLALAVSDCLFLLFATFEVTPSSIPSLATTPQFNYIYSHSVLYIRTLASTFYKSSVLIVIAFNVERYICVVHPLRSHRLCTGSSSRASILISLIISFLCSLQWPLCYRVRLCYEGLSESHFYVIMLTENETLRTYYRIMDYTCLFAFNVLPIAAVLLMNARLIVTLGRVAHEDAKRNDGRQMRSEGGLIPSPPVPQRLNANAMLFAVVLCLLVCVGPQAPARLLFDFYGQYHATAIVYTCVTQLLVFLNASLNFCLYCVVSRRYRALMRTTVKRLLQGWRERPLGLSLRTSKTSSAHATLLLEEQPSRPLVIPSNE